MLTSCRGLHEPFVSFWKEAPGREIGSFGINPCAEAGWAQLIHWTVIMIPPATLSNYNRRPWSMLLV
jgi:hypothetical protein